MYSILFLRHRWTRIRASATGRGSAPFCLCSLSSAVAGGCYLHLTALKEYTRPILNEVIRYHHHAVWGEFSDRPERQLVWCISCLSSSWNCRHGCWPLDLMGLLSSRNKCDTFDVNYPIRIKTIGVRNTKTISMATIEWVDVIACDYV